MVLMRLPMPFCSATDPIDAVRLDIEGADAGAAARATPHGPVSLIGALSSRVAPSAACSSRSTDSAKPHWWQPIKLACSIKPGASDGLRAKAQVGDGA